MRRLDRLAVRVALMLVLASGTASAQDASDGGLTAALELRAHQALMQRIAAADGTPAPFETDGCSGGLSDIWRLVAEQLPDFATAHQGTPPWESCCVIHDAAYHNAGGATTARASYDARVRADEALRVCVVETGETRKQQVAAHYDIDTASVSRAYGLIADAMHLAVRFGGAPCSGLSWRWGFGYPDCSILQQADTE